MIPWVWNAGMARPMRKIKINAMITKEEYAAAVDTAKKMRSARANGLEASLRLSIFSDGALILMCSIFEARCV
jgi:hypothetical protein